MPLLGVMLPFEFEQTIRDAMAICAQAHGLKKKQEQEMKRRKQKQKQGKKK